MARRELGSFRSYLIVFMALFAVASGSLSAGTISMAWDPLSHPDLVGYRVHYGTVSGNYTQTLDVGTTTQATLSVNNCTNYFIAVKGRAQDGSESPLFSNELSGWARPELQGATPSAVDRASTVNVTLVGTNFRSGATVQFSDPAIVVNSVTVAGCTQIVANVTVPASAGLGAKNITVVNPDQAAGTGTGLITVANAAPDGQILQPGSSVTIAEGDTVQFSGGGSDPDGNTPLTWLWDFGDPALSDSAQQNPGTVRFDNAGTFVVSLTVSDALGLADATPATRNVTVTAVNSPPTAADDSVTTNQDTPVTINVLTNDDDSDGTLNPGSVTVVSGPTSGSTSVNAGSGAITYTPNAGFNGSDSFVYRVADNEGATDTATVSVTVTAANVPPTAVADSASTNEDTPVTVDVLANDSDSDGSLVPSSVTVTSAPNNGSTAVNSSTGAITYTPNTGFIGNDSFVYRVADDAGATDTATVSISVTQTPPPAISALQAGSVGSTTATITWSTDRAADSQVLYRPVGDTVYQQTPLAAALVTSHAVALVGLRPGTAYEFSVRSADSGGLAATQDGAAPYTTQNNSFTYLRIEAESGPISPPAEIVSDGAAFRGAYVRLASGSSNGTPNNPSGTWDFGFQLPSAGTWNVWFRMYGQNNNSNAWLERVDGGNFQVVATPVNGSWSWVAGRSYTLGAGLHVLTLGGDESLARMDRMLITNDPGFTPTESPGGDTTPPAGVAGLSALPDDGANNLSWNNPAEAGGFRVVVRYSTAGSHPLHPADGQPLADLPGTPGAAESLVHTGLSNGTTYHYSVFIVDAWDNASNPATAQATPQSPTTPLGTVQNLRRTDTAN